MNFPRSTFLLVIALSLALAGCSKSSKPDPNVLATVGDRVFRADDVQKEIAWRQSNRRGSIEPRTVLDEMVQHESLVQQARGAGLEGDPEFQRAFRTLLVSKLKERELSTKLNALQVSPEELRTAYERQIERHTQPAKVRLALIQLKTDPRMTEPQLAETRARLDDARAQALSLAPGELGFGKVAVAFSEDQASRYKGGDAGWFDEGRTHYRWPTEVIRAGFALKTAGEVSEVIQGTNGFYLVKKLDTRPGSVTPQAQVEESLRRQILSEKRAQFEKSFLTQARQAARAQTFPDAIASLPAPAAIVAQRDSNEPPLLP